MRIGVLGGGQLGRMLAIAGVPMGHRFVFLDPSPAAPASEVGALIVGEYADPASLRRFLSEIDVVTFEFENVPAAALERIAEMATIPIRPGLEALRIGQDRLFEKTLFREIGLATPDFECATDAASLRVAIERVGVPCVVKSRRMGYDGKGQAVVRSPEEAAAAWSAISPDKHGVIVESFVRFDREVSILAVRSVDGSFAAYPLTQNTHESGILRRSIAPAPDLPPSLQAAAEAHARAIMDRLSYIGVLAIEFFVAGASLLGNEMAPRMHNSGHWTIEGAECSQFENHVRAVAGQPLGLTRMRCDEAAMINLIGVTQAAADRALRDPAAHVHWYGKDPRPGRKVGHITILSKKDSPGATRAAERVESLIAGG